METPMQKPNDLNQSRIVLKQDSTLIAVIEMSLSSWLVAGIVPGVERQPLKKLAVDESALLKLLNRWREEAEKAGRRIERITVAFEAGRDGFWLARWLRARGIEAHVIHASSVAVSREHRRAKTDRLDTELLKRAFLGWLRGERDHCKMVAIPTTKDEDAKRPNASARASSSATLATRAVASTGPTPGHSSSRMLISLDRCQVLIIRSNSRTCSLSLRSCVPRAARHARYLWNSLVTWTGDDIEQFLNTIASDRSDDPELSKMDADRIDH